MEKIVIDKRTGWKYELVGDYYLPVEMPMNKALEQMPEHLARRAAAAMTAILEVDAQVPAEEKTPYRIGRFGRAHAAYLKRTQLDVFSQLVAEGRLDSYLAQLDEQANSMLDLLIRQMATDHMEWVRCMNSILNRAEEVVNDSIVNI